MAVSRAIVLLIASAQLLIVQGNLENYEWVSYTPGIERIPAKAIIAGYDVDGSSIYVSQMRVEREKIPSQLIPSKSSSFAVHNGDIYKSPLTAVPTPILCGTNYAWVQASLGNFPKNAIPGGKTSSGDVVYIGRAEYNGSVILGAVNPTRSALFATFDGSQLEWFGTYKVLVFNDIDQWTRVTSENFSNDTVLAGFDNTKHELCVGIIRVGNQIIPAQINRQKMLATAAYHGGIAESEDFEVLIGGNYQWVAVRKGKVPTNVVIAGRTDDGEAIYVGRVVYRKSLLAGSVLSSERVLYINYLGKLRTVETAYDVLVRGKPLA